MKPLTTDALVALINHPDYKTDPKFREAVERRVAGADLTHGGTVYKSGVVDFGKHAGDTRESVGGISIKSGSDRRGSDGVRLESDVRHVSIDDSATYHGPLNSAHEIAQAFSNPEYAKNPAYREQVAAALSQMTPTNRPKF